MKIDSSPSPDMYLFGRAPQAHREVITAYAKSIYGESDYPEKTRALPQAVKHFMICAGESMQHEMDRLNGRKPRPFILPPGHKIG